MQDSFTIGVDIGGSHITAAVVDMHTGDIIMQTRSRAEVSSGSSIDSIIDCWSTIIKKVADEYKPATGWNLGIAMPGPCDYETGICLIKDQAKYDALYNQNIKELLAEKLSLQKSDIKMINDAAAFLQGEVYGELGDKYEKLIGLTLGTGLGSAIYENGIATDAALWCAPFRNGMAEDYLSSRWIVNQFHKSTGIQVPDVKTIIRDHGENIHTKKILEEFQTNLIDFLLPLIEKENPDAIIIGGNLRKAFPHFPASLEKDLNGKGVQVAVHLARHGENAALVGAATH